MGEGRAGIRAKDGQVSRSDNGGELLECFCTLVIAGWENLGWPSPSAGPIPRHGTGSRKATGEAPWDGRLMVASLTGSRIE